MTPSALILHTLSTYHRGKARAITREALRDYLRQVGHEMGDRDLREIVKGLKVVCMCNHGYFIAETKVEADESIAYLRKKIFPLWQDIENIIGAYPEFYPGGKQMELF
jgi:hypothetical protein